MATQSHVHKYYKSHIGWGKNKKVVYRCALPDCPHYAPPVAVLLKYSICWRCRKEFILPKAISLLTSKPWCPDCCVIRKKKIDEDIPILDISTTETIKADDLDDFLANLIGEKK